MIDENTNPWHIRSSAEIYQNNWIKLTEHQIINPSGGAGIYGEVHFKNLAIGIIPFDEHDHIWLVGQYRFPLKAYSWEIPEGGGALDTDPLISAKRELLEETGLVAQQWEEIQRVHLSNSVSDELGIIYLASILEQYQSCPEETEQLVIKRIHFQEALEMVLQGTITDSMSVIGILRLAYRFKNKI